MQVTQRLTTVKHRLVFIGVVFGSLLNTLRNLNRDAPILPLVLIAGVYVVIGTLGWVACYRSRSRRLLSVYWTVQCLLVVLFAVLEMRISHRATTSIPLLVPLIFQSTVLTKRERYTLVGVVYVSIWLTTLLFVPIVELIVPGIIYLILLMTVVYFGNLMDHEEKARAALDAANQKLVEYARQAEELAATRERNRLAREIHDNLGHYLTAVNMQIEAAMAVMATDSARSLYALERAQTLTKEGLSEIRRSIAALRAAPTEMRPLHEAILTLVKEHQAAGLRLDYQVEGAVRPCSAQIELALYRIAQEGLTNIRKHARANHAYLILDYCNAHAVGLQVEDDGIGTGTTDSGFGLLGIQERVDLLGGSLTLRTATGDGFTLRVELPG